MTANRWSPLSVFLAGGLSGAALIFVCVDEGVTQLENAGDTQRERDSELLRRAEAPLLARADTDLPKPGHAAGSQGHPVGANGASTAALAPVNGVEAAEEKSAEDAPAEAGRSLAQVLAGLEAEYRRQVSTPDLPSPAEPAALETASPAPPPSTSAAVSAGRPAEHEQKHPEPAEAPARNVPTVATAEETGVTNEQHLNEQHLVTAQIQQLAALQQLAITQQIAASQQLAVAQQLALLQYLQLVPPSFAPVSPASASSQEVPQERRLPRGAFVTRFPSPTTAIGNTSGLSGFYSAPTILVR